MMLNKTATQSDKTKRRLFLALMALGAVFIAIGVAGSIRMKELSETMTYGAGFFCGHWRGRAGVRRPAAVLRQKAPRKA